MVLLILPANAKLGFVGIGVSDIDNSTKFYQDILGLDVIGTYDDVTVDNADGSESFLDEVVLGYKDKPGTLLVLMNWPNDNKKYDGDNTKIVFEVKDAKAVIEKIRKAGGKIEGDEIYYSFGYHANGVNTAPWAGKKLADLMIGSNSKQLQISKLYLGLPKKFILPSMRLMYLKIAYFYYSLIDR